PEAAPPALPLKPEDTTPTTTRRELPVATFQLVVFALHVLRISLLLPPSTRIPVLAATTLLPSRKQKEPVMWIPLVTEVGLLPRTLHRRIRHEESAWMPSPLLSVATESMMVLSLPRAMPWVRLTLAVQLMTFARPATERMPMPMLPAAMQSLAVDPAPSMM